MIPEKKSECLMVILSKTRRSYFVICENVEVLSENCEAGTSSAFSSVRNMLDRGGLVGSAAPLKSHRFRSLVFSSSGPISIASFAFTADSPISNRIAKPAKFRADIFFLS